MDLNSCYNLKTLLIVHLVIVIVCGVHGLEDCQSVKYDAPTKCTDNSTHTGCSSCSRPRGGCQYCAGGYALHRNADGSSVRCIACEDTCMDCTADEQEFTTTCTNCQPGYFLTPASHCQECSIECAECTTSNTTCTNCHPGFFLSDTDHTCTNCPSHCKSCSSKHSCDKCAEGYTRAVIHTGVQCKDCSVGCVRCLDADVCLSCDEGYYLTGRRACAVCPDGCEICTGFTIEVGTRTQQKCTACTHGWSLVGEGQCVQCSLSHCISCSSSDVCTACEAGYYLREDTGTCQACHSHRNCLTCSSSTTCETCAEGQYLDHTLNRCLACAATMHCSSCADPGDRCTVCESGKYMDPNTGRCPYSCTISGAGCHSCLNSTHCDTCEDGYYLDDQGQCQVCSKGACLLCEALDNCTLCVDSHYWNGTHCVEECDETSCRDNKTNACVRLPYTTSQCTICDSRDDGAYVNCLDCSGDDPTVGLYQELCQKCEVPDCIECDNGVSTCTQCQDGLFYDADINRCIGCYVVNSLCTLCSNGTTCLECEYGYYPDGYYCLQCPEGCPTCTSADDDCTELLQSSGECAVDNCASCDEVCCSCKRGYYADRNTCKQTVYRCHSCNPEGAADDTSCTKEVNSRTSQETCSFLEDEACWSVSTSTYGGADTTVSSRLCRNETCTNTSRISTCLYDTVSQVLECGTCCNNMSLCNTHTLPKTILNFEPAQTSRIHLIMLIVPIGCALVVVYNVGEYSYRIWKEKRSRDEEEDDHRPIVN